MCIRNSLCSLSTTESCPQGTSVVAHPGLEIGTGLQLMIDAPKNAFTCLRSSCFVRGIHTICSELLDKREWIPSLIRTDYLIRCYLFRQNLMSSFKKSSRLERVIIHTTEKRPVHDASPRTLRSFRSVANYCRGTMRATRP
jgi:hypothetical protein